MDEKMTMAEVKVLAMNIYIYADNIIEARAIDLAVEFAKIWNCNYDLNKKAVEGE